MGILEFTLRLACAFGFGALIGIERHWRQRNAGLRTNTLVATGAAAFILLSIEIGGDATGRIASYIVSGIGFLGAGVIMKDGQNVQGLNTAATIWCSAAVGALCGIGLFPQAGIVTVFIMLIHILLRPVGNKLNTITNLRTAFVQTDYQFNIQCKPEVENHIRILLLQRLGNDDKLLLKSLSSVDQLATQEILITAVIISHGQQDSLIEKIASRLTIEEDVSKVSWEIIATHFEN